MSAVGRPVGRTAVDQVQAIQLEKKPVAATKGQLLSQLVQYVSSAMSGPATQTERAPQLVGKAVTKEKLQAQLQGAFSYAYKKKTLQEASSHFLDTQLSCANGTYREVLQKTDPTLLSLITSFESQPKNYLAGDKVVNAYKDFKAFVDSALGQSMSVSVTEEPTHNERAEISGQEIVTDELEGAVAQVFTEEEGPLLETAERVIAVDKSEAPAEQELLRNAVRRPTLRLAKAVTSKAADKPASNENVVLTADDINKGILPTPLLLLDDEEEPTTGSSKTDAASSPKAETADIIAAEVAPIPPSLNADTVTSGSSEKTVQKPTKQRRNGFRQVATQLLPQKEGSFHRLFGGMRRIVGKALGSRG